MKDLILVLLFAFPLTSARAEPDSAFEQAEAAYRTGNCDAAIELYGEVLRAKASKPDQRSTANFRIAYCHYSKGEAELAEKHFQKYLKVFPKDEEARLRYAESLFQQGKWANVIQDTVKSQGTWSKGELEVLIGRSFLELRDPETAIVHLRQVPSGSPIEPTATYWRGVAEYQKGDRNAARVQFDHARQFANAPGWIREYSNDWIRSIKQDLAFFQGSLTLGYFYDGNLSFTSTQTVNPTTGQPLLFAPNESSYIKDRGFLIDPKLYGTVFESHPLSLTYLLEASIPLHASNSSYDNESFNGTISLHYSASPKLKFGLDVRYLDSRYNNLYYQDFLTLTPNATWSPHRDWTFTLSVPYTDYLITRNLTLIAPAVGARYQALSNLSLNAGLSYSKTQGAQATYTSGNPAYVSTGTIFSNSSTFGGSLGAGLQLPKGFYLSAQAGFYSTQYAAEAASVSGGASARKDNLLMLSADLYFDWIKDLVALDLSYSQYNNSSSGFQGIAYGSTMSTYNYQRPYVLFSTILKF